MERGLTKREREVLGGIARDLSNAEIARSLGIAPATVKAHITAIFQKLGVANRTEAARVAQDLDLID